MNDFIFVHVLKSNDNVGHEELGLPLVEDSFVAEVVPEVTAVEVVHDEEEVFAVLEGVLDVDEE